MGFLARQSAHTFAINVITKFGIGLLLDVMISRALGPDGKGQYSLFVTTLTGLLAFFSFGVPIANTILGAKKSIAFPKLIKLSLWLSILAATFSVLVLLFGNQVDFLRYVLPSKGFNTNTVLLCLVLPLVFLNNFWLGTVMGKGEIFFNNYLTLIGQSVVCVIVGLAFVFSALTPKVAIASFLISFIISLAAITNRYWDDIKIALHTELTWQEAGSVLKFSSVIYLGAVMQFLNYRLDRYFVQYFGGDTELGLYDTAVRLSESIWLVSASIASSLMPTVAAGNENSRNATVKLAIGAFIISFVLAIGVLIAGKLAIVTLFTTKFANAFEPLLWLLPGTVLFSIANIFASYIAGIGKPMMNTLISASVVVCTIFFDMLLIPHYGIIGAAIASSIAYAMMTILTMIIFVRLTNLKSKQIFPLIKELSQDMKHSFQKSKQRIGL